MSAKASSSTHTNPKPVAEVGGIPNGGSARQRGPVEEVIAKRMKQLGKKLQRYRTYISADPTTLNADQKAALVSLPALEGAYKELEDLVREKGPVEEQELIQAAKLREATEAAKAAALAEAGASIEQYKASLVQPLSLFLRLHALLHPARPSDHEHITFSALTLPSQLQDEVQATDVLRVGRIYEDLRQGGEAGSAALDSLVKGKTGEDEENDHVHHLLDLLSQPAKPVVESAPETPGNVASEDFTAAALATSAEEAIEAAPEGAVVPNEEIDLPNGHSQEHPTSHKPSINFLQADEVHEASEEVKDGGKEEPAETVQTAGATPPLANPVETPVSARAARDFAPMSSSNWADLDDEDVPAESTAPQAAETATAGSVIDVKPTETIQESTLAEAPAQTSGDASVAETAAPATGGSSRPPRGPKNARKPSNRGRPQGGEQRQNSQRGQAQTAQPGQKTVDDDGFELKGRRNVPQQAQQPTRGRGSGRGGPGGRGGRGGRGGANGARVNSESGPNGQIEGQGQAPRQNRPPAAQRQVSQQEPKPKASIYKTVQPTGPTSAPIH